MIAGLVIFGSTLLASISVYRKRQKKVQQTLPPFSKQLQKKDQQLLRVM